MAHMRRFARAGALAWTVLAASALALPSLASPLQTDSLATDGPAEGSTAPATPGSTVDSAPASPTSAQALTLEVSATESPGPPSVTPSPSTSATVPASVEETPTQTDEASSPTPTSSDLLQDSPTPTATLTETTAPDSLTPTEPPTPSTTPSATLTETPTLDSATLTETPTQSPTPTLTEPPPIAAAFAPGAVLINEVAWAGTLASPNDEWIELWNPGPEPIDLTDWILSDGGDLTARLSGAIAGFSLYLVERTDDQTVSDISADRIYTGSLSNGGERLELIDPAGTVIDTANAAGAAWPAGNTTQRASMERHGLLDVPGSWSTFPGFGGNGLDADGNPIPGTPRQPNAPSLPTPSPTPTTPGGPFPPEAVILNEVAWAGTLASTSDEWIELFNPGTASVNLDGWTLTDGGDIEVTLRGDLPGGSYYVLERGDDQTVSDQAAEVVYSGALSNGGETLSLLDPTDAEIDVVNPAGGAWPAGDAALRSSMERINGAWRTFTGFNGLGLDAAGRPVRGTPHGPNSALFPTPLPTWIPGKVVINEVLVRPRYDWEGAGGVTTDDEFIELFNRGPAPVNLRGWTLDDFVVGGSSPFELPAITIGPGAYAVFFRSRTGIALNDAGDSVRLSAPDGSAVDKVRYQAVRAVNLSYGRLPDGDEVQLYGLWPTPGRSNILYTPPSFPPESILINEVAWAGTFTSPSDEWIELWNPGTEPINLFGWTLTDGNDVRVHLAGVLESDDYALLERTDDETIPTLPAFALYSGALADDGESLHLIDPAGNEIDALNPGNDAWPAGDAVLRASMERVDGGWRTFSLEYFVRRDPLGRPIRGTPASINSHAAAMAVAGMADCGEADSHGPGLCP